MKATILILLAVLALTGCGSQISCTGDAALCTPVQTFKAEAKARGIPDSYFMGVSVRYATDAEMAAGEGGHCQAVDGIANTIKIRQDSFAGMDPRLQEATVFHELGHCAIGRKHTSATMEWPSGMPVSIMWPTSGTEFYLSQRAFYIDELFNMTPDEGLIK